MATAKKNTVKKLVNNVIFVIDSSSSMHTHSRKVNEVVSGLIAPLQNAGIETRVSLYTFSNSVQRALYTSAPSTLRSFYLRPSGMTALLDATGTAIEDHLRLRSPANEDHSYLLYVITDGEENVSSKFNPATIARLMNDLEDNWTVATLVPNQRAVHSAKMCGFPAGNIEVWDVNSADGFEEVGLRLADTYTNYANARSMGVTGTKTLFADASKLSKPVAKQVLVEDKSAKLIAIQKAGRIDEIVEEKTGRPYVPGTVFYELTKSELVQAKKELAVVAKSDGKRYFGPQARQLLGLPNAECRVRPGDHGDWRVFVQSTSLNRKLIGGTSILVR